MRIIKEGFTVGAQLVPVREPGSAHPQRFDLSVNLNVSSRNFGGSISADQVIRARYPRGNGTGSAKLEKTHSFNGHGTTVTTFSAVIKNVDANVLKTGVRIALTGQGSDVLLQGSAAAFPISYKC